MGKAIGALEAGASGGSFLQNSAVPLLKQITVTMDLNSADRDALSAFLSTGEAHRYAPQSGEITGILKQMKETMEGDLADADSKEKESAASFEEMSKAKAKEIQ